VANSGSEEFALHDAVCAFARSAAPFLFLSGLDVDGDVGKKKAVRKSEALEKRTAAEKKDAVEQRAEKGGEGAEAAGPATKTRKKKRPVPCIQRHTDVEFRREFPEVFDALVKKAREGGTAETRLLLQIGKFGDAKSAKRRGAKSLSAMLMDELRRRQDEREAAGDTAKDQGKSTEANEASSEGATSGGDAENG
jgi:hypothetical protein